jgi:hypothetical protein
MHDEPDLGSFNRLNHKSSWASSVSEGLEGTAQPSRDKDRDEPDSVSGSSPKGLARIDNGIAFTSAMRI